MEVYMNEKTLRKMVESILLCEMAKSGELIVPVSSSNRHVHLSQKDINQLFGMGYQLTKIRDLVQPGQYACEESVTLETGKGKLLLRVVGPVRKETQVELTFTEAVKLGISPVIRMSGDVAGTPGGVLKNGDKQVTILQGIIVAARHLHLSSDQAECYGLKDGDIVSLHIEGIRKVIYNNVAVRAGQGHTLEAHIDREEANAALLQDGAFCRIEQQQHTVVTKIILPESAKAPPTPQGKDERRLITEEDVKAAHAAGQTVITYAAGAIITPLARDAAWEYHIEI